jgi:hypothetical protein
MSEIRNPKSKIFPPFLFIFAYFYPFQNIITMKLRNILAILFLMAGLSTQAQMYNYGFSSYTSFGNPYGLQNSMTPAKFNLQTGAGFSSGFGGGSLFNTYVAPSFNQQLGKKFTLSAGAVINNTTFSNTMMLNNEGSFSPVSGNLTTFTIFTSGAYQVNDRLTLTGSAYKTINPAFNARLNSDNIRMEAQGMSVGVGYRIGDNMHIGAEIRMEQGNSNFYNLYTNPVSPFGNNRFGF